MGPTVHPALKRLTVSTRLPILVASSDRYLCGMRLLDGWMMLGWQKTIHRLVHDNYHTP